MSSRPKFDSRKATSWDSKGGLTATEAFMKQHHLVHYGKRHRIVYLSKSTKGLPDKETPHVSGESRPRTPEAFPEFPCLPSVYS